MFSLKFESTNRSQRTSVGIVSVGEIGRGALIAAAGLLSVSVCAIANVNLCMLYVANVLFALLQIVLVYVIAIL